MLLQLRHCKIGDRVAIFPKDELTLLGVLCLVANAGRLVSERKVLEA